MQGYKLENIDCFCFQYTRCDTGQCKFQHRQSCKESSEICLDWFRHRRCRNQMCSRKHLNHEVMLAYFLCRAEKTENHCKQLNCLMYHEKARQFIEYGTIPPNSVPMVPAVRRKMVDCVKREVPQVQNFIKSGNHFLKMVRPFIAKSVRERKLSQDKGKAYFKEILHTVLFYGSINWPSIEPEEMLEQREFQLLSSKYPDVFQQYNTHLPTRPPYTVLLDVVVEIMGRNEEEKVLKCLLSLTEQMVLPLTDDKSSKVGNVFVSTVINYCYFWDSDIKNEKTDNYFGASVSCKGRQQRQIMIDILCCQTWHKHISLAVCIGNMYKNQAVWFPPEVHSLAFNIIFNEESPPAPSATPDNQHVLTVVGSAGVQEPNSLEISRTPRQRASLIPRVPCERCLDMFPNINYHPNPEYHGHPYWEHGNCAECESLSQLLYANQLLAMRLQFYVQRTILSSPTEQIHLPHGLIGRKLRRLEDNLRSLGFNVGLFSFYDPSGIESTALERFQH
ncbi:uncharacterized protein [Heptranchias perlo]|uniref:uncharacterized protein isoform X2 n=1 Tax=Heptranchias perlo TaxID=212740 RepID=UPI003559D0A1